SCRQNGPDPDSTTSNPKMEYDSLMGLAAVSALPVVAVAALFLCAPLAAQPRPGDPTDIRIIQ
ncbi:MAG: hypothetical protein ACREIE_08155, partial [Nitrospiraceae bacterium]